ncbi:MAG: phosphoribosyltransferase [Alphaproteobacteria bacterium]|nr:phosphoribosyltransferase [Alphaproteobacteria bacterium]
MFQDRFDAGKQLADKLKVFASQNPLIFALPRGGVPVAFVVAKALKSPFHVFVARKIGVPWQPELGVGAVAPGVQVFNRELLQELDLKISDLTEIIKREEQELKRRLSIYGVEENFEKIKGKTVILIDDGLATGITAEAALKSLKQWAPKKLIFAVPVGVPSTVEHLKKNVTELICLEMPPHLYAIGAHYLDFSQVSDEEVIDLLKKSQS